MERHDVDICRIITPTSPSSFENDDAEVSVMEEESTPNLFKTVFGCIPVRDEEEEEEKSLGSHTIVQPKTRTRKSKLVMEHEYEEFLVLAKSATPRLVIMRDLGLSNVAFNRHYLTALTTGEIMPIPDGTVFKPTSFPKEIRELLGCGGFDLISVEVSDAGLVLKKI